LNLKLRPYLWNNLYSDECHLLILCLINDFTLNYFHKFMDLMKIIELLGDFFSVENLSLKIFSSKIHFKKNRLFSSKVLFNKIRIKRIFC